MIRLLVNGRTHEVKVKPHETLADVLRKKLGFTGVRFSCGAGECGSCTILLDGKPVPSCMILALQAEGKEIVTIEGLGSYDNLHPVQQAFIEEHGFQCGFCTPGVILSSKALLDKNPKPLSSEVAEALSGHICRCGSYAHIIKSVLRAGEILKKDDIND